MRFIGSQTLQGERSRGMVFVVESPACGNGCVEHERHQ